MTSGRLPWRILVPAVLAPNIFYATGRGAVIPVLPVLAVSMHASLSTAAFVSALLTVGELSTVLAASWLVVRVGERNSMLIGSGVSALGAALGLFAHGVALLGVGVFLIGSASSVYLMARQAWVALTIPAAQRGRAYSLVAGSQRTGMLIGPFLTAGVLALANHPRWAFLITIGAAVAVAVILYLWPTPPEPQVEVLSPDEEMPGVFRTVYVHRGVLARLGSAAALLSSMRAVRQILIPLWGAHLGLSPVNITLIVGATSAIDVLFFYSGGQITDRFGRMWVSLPTMLGFAVANLGLAICVGLPHQFAIFITMAVVMSFANAIGSGVNATMGADLADPRQPAVFLGPWRLMGALGGAVVPMAFAGLTAISLTFGTAAMGGLGLVGSWAMWSYIPRYLPDRKLGRRSERHDRSGDPAIESESP